MVDGIVSAALLAKSAYQKSLRLVVTVLMVFMVFRIRIGSFKGNHNDGCNGQANKAYRWN